MDESPTHRPGPYRTVTVMDDKIIITEGTGEYAYDYAEIIELHGKKLRECTDAEVWPEDPEATVKMGHFQRYTPPR